MPAFYNEIDPYAAQWLRNLIDAGHIAPGVVDERDIRDLCPNDLAGFAQCHFFAGIGMWSAALRRARWDDNRPIWTGSCPCQPFSAAGRRAGFVDERHLWPHWFHLISQCAPPIVAGEQVASKDGLQWLDLVSTDLEGADYAFGASDLCAAGFGGAHIRQRLYFVGMANAQCAKWRSLAKGRNVGNGTDSRGQKATGGNGEYCTASGLADDDNARPQGCGQPGRVEGEPSRLEHLLQPRLEGHAGHGDVGGQSGWHGPDTDGPVAATGSSGGVVGVDHAGKHQRPSGGEQPLRVVGDRADQSAPIRHPRQARSLDDVDWLLCRNPAGEPSWRPVESESFPLAHGASSRMGKLRAYGNGLDLETATNFIEAVMEL